VPMTHAGLIITYARKENVLRLVDELIKNGVQKIYISIDGPQNKNVEAIQSELKLELNREERDFSNQIQIWQRKVNMGSGASVIASLDWVFSSEEEVIILEDDLEIGEGFFQFMKYGLGEMTHERNLKIVTGTNPFEKVTKSRPGRLNYPVSWGWATNRANWQDLRALLFSATPTKFSIPQLHKNLYWRIGQKRALLGQIEAWDVPLASEMYKTSFYTLVPPDNLVRNIGFDQYAAHTSESAWPLNLPIFKYGEMINYKFDLSDCVDLNKNFEKQIFQIRTRHILSWVLHRITDRYRFKSPTVSLFDRTKMERHPNS
jgi:hypothetical protein